MQAALFMRMKRTPLQSLESRVRERYSKFLRLRKSSELGIGGNFSNLCLRNPDIESYFRNQDTKRRKADTEAEEDPRISMTITIKSARLSEVKTFIWDLNEQVVKDKFDFATSRVALKDKAEICANTAEGHLILTRRCFDLLLDEPSKETQMLSQYAMKNLMS